MLVGGEGKWDEWRSCRRSADNYASVGGRIRNSRSPLAATLAPMTKRRQLGLAIMVLRILLAAVLAASLWRAAVANADSVENVMVPSVAMGESHSPSCQGGRTRWCSWTRSTPQTLSATG